MGICTNKQWMQDIEYALTCLPELSELAGRKIMITGCTGLVCSAVVDALISWNCSHDEKINIYALSRNVTAVKERFAPFSNETWFEAEIYDAIKPLNGIKQDCDYIIHGAGNASPGNIVNEPVETMYANIFGVKNLLEYAKSNNSSRLLYVSSSEVYGKSECNKPLGKTDYGYIDILDSRSSYSIGKRAAETLCSSYLDEYGVDCVIVRPGHIYGPTAKSDDNRVSSAWAYKVAKGQDIIMKSDGAQIRSYCYAPDAASAILKALIKGKTLEAYNISNEDSVISIREMAETMAHIGNVKVIFDNPTDLEKKGFNPMRNSSLDAKELMNLGWKGRFNAETGIEHTIKILRDFISH